MSVLEHNKYHAEDLWYNQQILKNVAQYRNVQTFVIKNHPNFLFKWKYYPLKMKTFIPDPERKSVLRLVELAKTVEVPVLELITNRPETLVESFPCQIMKSYRATFLIDLNKSLEELFSGLRDFRRRNIQKAQREKVIVKSETNESIFNEWWRLYLTTSRRGHFVPQKRGLIHDLLRNRNCRLFTAWRDDRLLAGAVIVANNYPYFWIGASAPEFPEFQASSMLHWQIIIWYKNLGFSRYDMGGASLEKDHGPTRFKEAFGGDLVKTLHYELVFKPRMKSIIDDIVTIYYRKLKRETF